MFLNSNFKTTNVFLKQLKSATQGVLAIMLPNHNCDSLPILLQPSASSPRKVSAMLLVAISSLILERCSKQHLN